MITGEKLSLDGMHTRAVDAWKKEIQNMTGVYICGIHVEQIKTDSEHDRMLNK